jgi:hypothetical protein
MAVQFVMAAPCRLELLLGSWRNVTLAIPFMQFSYAMLARSVYDITN